MYMLLWCSVKTWEKSKRQ